MTTWYLKRTQKEKHWGISHGGLVADEEEVVGEGSVGLVAECLEVVDRVRVGKNKRLWPKA